MNILWLEPHLNVIGAIRRVIEMSNRLIARGHKVTICTPDGRPPTWLPFAGRTIPLKGQVYLDHYDVLIFNLPEQYTEALRIQARLKVQYVLSYEPMYRAAPTLESFRHKFFRLANSEFIAQKVQQHTGIKPPVINGGINPVHFYPANLPKEFDVLYYGSKRPWKGSSLIAEAVKMIGATAYSMEGKGIPQKEMGKLYSRARIFVSAALVEGFSFPQLESMASGTPVVTTDDQGCREYVKPGINALVVPERSAIALAKGIDMLLHDEPYRNSLIEEGLKTARAKEFTWDYLTTRLEDILTKQLSQGAPR